MSIEEIAARQLHMSSVERIESDKFDELRVRCSSADSQGLCALNRNPSDELLARYTASRRVAG